MKASKKRVIVVVFLFSLVALGGCDLISPKAKKPPKVDNGAGPAKTVTASPEKSKLGGAGEALSGNVLAKVGSWSITTDEFNERLKGLKKVLKDFDEKQPGVKQMVLQELIRQQLLVYEARQEKLDQSKDIQAAVADFENTLLVQEFATRMTKDIQATEQEAKDYYAANPDQFVMPVEKQLREIVVPTETEAKDVLVQVLQNGDFVQIAKDKSKGKTAADGGDLGFVAQAPFAQMQKEIEALKKGEVSRVFSGPDGFYIVKVDNVRGGDKKPFDEIKTQLVDWLKLRKQQETVIQKIEEVSKKINVQVNVDLLKE